MLTRTLISTPPSLFVFLSGIIVSIATSAIAKLTFDELNHGEILLVIFVAIIALMASIFWFLLSEKIRQLNLKLDLRAAAYADIDKAYNSIATKEKITIIIIFICAVLLSFLWPFANVFFGTAPNIATECINASTNSN